MPVLPAARREQLMDAYDLSPYDAAMVTASRGASDYLDQALLALQSTGPLTAARVKLLANWIMGELASALNRDGLEIGQSPLSPQRLAGLLDRISDGTVSNKIGREVFAMLWADASLCADHVIEAQGLRQVQDSGQLQGWVLEVVEANPRMVEEFRSGRDKALNALVGQVMKRSGGKANPQAVTDLLRAALAEAAPGPSGQ
jgi:aspartyl-tRNA(Asn)/glutamyl-tRNA(Gln) amidotransferase subunit B